MKSRSIPSSIILVVGNGERKFDEVYSDSAVYDSKGFLVSGARHGISVGYR